MGQSLVLQGGLVSRIRRCHLTGMAHLKLTVVVASGARIGPGKAKLLESIRDTGSISAAAREMGMSYKRAWQLLDSLNTAFEPAVITTSMGGPGGGGARLTDFGHELLERYRRMQEQSQAMFGEDLERLEQVARPDAGPKV
jgi:molybdate transport system regulatory protein